MKWLINFPLLLPVCPFARATEGQIVSWGDRAGSYTEDLWLQHVAATLPCVKTPCVGPLIVLSFSIVGQDFLNKRFLAKLTKDIQTNWPAFTVGSLCKAWADALMKADMKPNLTPCFLKNASLFFFLISLMLLQETKEQELFVVCRKKIIIILSTE